MLVGKDNAVVVYSKQNCPQCVVVKNDFKIRGIEYTEIFIDESPEDAAALLAKGHRSVPVVYVDGRHIRNPGLMVNERPPTLV